MPLHERVPQLGISSFLTCPSQFTHIGIDALHLRLSYISLSRCFSRTSTFGSIPLSFSPRVFSLLHSSCRWMALGWVDGIGMDVHAILSIPLGFLHNTFTTIGVETVVEQVDAHDALDESSQQTRRRERVVGVVGRGTAISRVAREAEPGEPKGRRPPTPRHARWPRPTVRRRWTKRSEKWAQDC